MCRQQPSSRSLSFVFLTETESVFFRFHVALGRSACLRRVSTLHYLVVAFLAVPPTRHLRLVLFFPSAFAFSV